MTRSEAFSFSGRTDPFVTSNTLPSSNPIYNTSNLFSDIKTMEEASSSQLLKDQKSLLDYEKKLNDQIASSANEFASGEAEKLREWQEKLLGYDKSGLSVQEYNSLEAQKQRDYETEMSNSAYQRAVIDLQKAGLNPVLAVKLGGASTPSGVSASTASVPSGSAAQPTSSKVSGKTAKKSELASALVQLITAQLSNSAQEVSAIGSVLSGIGHIIPF